MTINFLGIFQVFPDVTGNLEIDPGKENSHYTLDSIVEKQCLGS